MEEETFGLSLSVFVKTEHVTKQDETGAGPKTTSSMKQELEKSHASTSWARPYPISNAGKEKFISILQERLRW